MLSSSLVLGPAIGGILIATLGVQYCFLYDTLSYIPAILTILAMRLPVRSMQALTGIRDTLLKLWEGFEYVCKFQAIRAILLMLALNGLVGMSHIALMPVFAAKVLNGDATTMAHLSTSAPIGSLLACVYLKYAARDWRLRACNCSRSGHDWHESDILLTIASSWAVNDRTGVYRLL